MIKPPYDPEDPELLAGQKAFVGRLAQVQAAVLVREQANADAAERAALRAKDQMVDLACVGHSATEALRVRQLGKTRTQLAYVEYCNTQADQIAGDAAMRAMGTFTIRPTPEGLVEAQLVPVSKAKWKPPKNINRGDGRKKKDWER